MATIYDMADDIVAAINAGGLDVTATRGYLVDYDLPDLTTTRVTVIPLEEKRERESRDCINRLVRYNVFIGKKLADGDGTTVIDNAEVDALVKLASDIAILLEGTALPTTNNQPIAIKREVISYDALADHRLFACALTVTYLFYENL